MELDWTPLPNDAQRVAMATLLGIEEPQDRGRFIHAMFGLVHLNNASPTETGTVIEALKASELGSGMVREDHPLLDDLAVRSAELGVTTVPSLVRHGPLLAIHLNPAVLNEEPQQVARTIDAVIESDGIWELRKP